MVFYTFSESNTKILNPNSLERCETNNTIELTLNEDMIVPNHPVYTADILKNV